MKRTLVPLVLAVLAIPLQGCAVLFAVASGDPMQVVDAGIKTKDKMDAAVDNIPEKDERALGQGTAFHVIGTYKGLVLEEGLVSYVNEVGNYVALHGKRQVLRRDGTPRIASRRVFVGVLDDDTYDAFALPGGYIFITRGLLEDLGSESELAWVLGHELAHIDREDGLKVMKKQMQAGVALTDGMFDLNDSKLFGKLAGYIADNLLKSGWDSGVELEADKLGLAYAAGAGYDPRGADRVLAILATRAANTRTHASPAERAKALSGKVEALSKANSGKYGAERYDERCIRSLESYASMKATSGTQGGLP